MPKPTSEPAQAERYSPQKGSTWANVRQTMSRVNLMNVEYNATPMADQMVVLPFAIPSATAMQQGIFCFDPNWH
ncbi:MAG: hypothetical protein U0175_21855 [Caldilineaceae bacterium]